MRVSEMWADLGGCRAGRARRVEACQEDDAAPDDDGLNADRHVAAIGRIRQPPAEKPHIAKKRCAFWNGFSVHADVRIHAN
jgi:hypothetical protein